MMSMEHFFAMEVTIFFSSSVFHMSLACVHSSCSVIKKSADASQHISLLLLPHFATALHK